MTQSAVALVSGGIDSVTMAHLLHAEGWELLLLSADYGQRHRKEIECAAAAAQRLGADHHVADLRALTPLLSGSALTDDAVGVPDGHYTDESMRSTVVPNRNAILLSVAVGAAVARGADAVAYAAHTGDHPIYPDCRPEFVSAFEHLAVVANQGFASPGFRVLAPFIDASKADIVRRGASLGVPFADTWSCYRGGDRHCGTCGTCVERQEAFDLAGVPDPTEYVVAAA